MKNQIQVEKSQMEQRQTCGGCEVPEEVVAVIFGFLPWRTCLSLRSVCQRWRRLSDDDRSPFPLPPSSFSSFFENETRSLWRVMVAREYGKDAAMSQPRHNQQQGWRDYFIHRKTTGTARDHA
jgi:hypothetical protein